MFVLKGSPTVVWPVDIPVPSDGGKVEKNTVNITYKLLPQEQYEAINGNDIDLLTEVVVGWDEQAFGKEIVVSGETETVALQFTQDNLQNLLQFPFVRTGLIQGYWQAQAGLEKN